MVITTSETARKENTLLLVAVTVRPPFAPPLWDGRAVEFVLAETLVDLVVHLAQPELESFAALLDCLVRRVRLHVLLEVAGAPAARIQRRQGSEEAEHGRFLVRGRLRRKVGDGGVEEGPGVAS